MKNLKSMVSFDIEPILSPKARKMKEWILPPNGNSLLAPQGRVVKG
jgi:hypothetical protein